MVTGLAVPTHLPCFEKRVPREVAAGRVGARLVDIGCPGSSWVPSQQPGRGLRGAAQCLAVGGGVGFCFRPFYLCALHGCKLSLGPEGKREGPPPWLACLYPHTVPS